MRHRICYLCLLLHTVLTNMRWVGACATFLLNPFKFHIGLDDFSPMNTQTKLHQKLNLPHVVPTWWQCWKTNSDNDFFSSFSFQDDLNYHCNAMSCLIIVCQADFRECSVGFTGKSELSACDIITVSWPFRVEEWRQILIREFGQICDSPFEMWSTHY